MSKDQIGLRILSFRVIIDDLFEFRRDPERPADIFCADVRLDTVFSADVLVAELQNLLKLKTGPYSDLKHNIIFIIHLPQLCFKFFQCFFVFDWRNPVHTIPSLLQSVLSQS